MKQEFFCKKMLQFIVSSSHAIFKFDLSDNCTSNFFYHSLVSNNQGHQLTAELSNYTDK